MVKFSPPDFEELTSDAASGNSRGAATRRLLADKDLKSIPDLAEELEVSPSTIRRWMFVGTKHRVTGRRIRLDALRGTGGYLSSNNAYYRMLENLNDGSEGE